MNYTCLGRNEKFRERRHRVLTLFLRGAKPAEIAEIMTLQDRGKGITEKTTVKTVYNDILFLRSTKLHDLPVDLVRDLGNSFYESKITELERKLKANESNPSVWLGIQKLILDYKKESMKLLGAQEPDGAQNNSGVVIQLQTIDCGTREE